MGGMAKVTADLTVYDPVDGKHVWLAATAPKQEDVRLQVSRWPYGRRDDEEPNLMFFHMKAADLSALIQFLQYALAASHG